MSSDLSAPRIGEWIRWLNASSKTDPTYKAKALLAVLETDGPKMLAAVLRQAKLERTQQLIEAMRVGVEADKRAESRAYKAEEEVPD